MSFKKLLFLCCNVLVVISGCKNKNPYFVNDIVLVSPNDESMLYRDQLYFNWKSVDAFSNKLQLSSSSGFSSLIADTLADSAVYITQPQDFDLGKTYYWRVLSEPNAGNTLISASRSFSIIDTRDSIVGTYSAQLRKQTWDLPSTPLKDTTYSVSVTISKLSWSKVKVVCNQTPNLLDMSPHADNGHYHFGNDGAGVTVFQVCNYDNLLRKITLEYSGGDSNTGYHYWFTIYK